MASRLQIHGQPHLSSLLREVLGLEEISHVLWLGVEVLDVVVVAVAIVGRAHVVHLVGRTALHAARLRLITGQGDPENVVGVCRETSAADVLLISGRVDNNGVLWGACIPSISILCYLYRPGQMLRILLLGRYVPRRLASSGLMSKISIPCIFPRTSRRSRPVACSASVGTVPG
jgi:hypothetical protein